MDLAQIKELLKIVADSGVAEVEIEEDDFKLIVRKNAPSVTMQPPPMYPSYGMAYPMGGFTQPTPPQGPQVTPSQGNTSSPASSQHPQPAAAPAEEAEGQAENEFVVKAPIVGTFFRKPAPDEAEFVNVGDEVQQGDVLCIIEAMKLMNEIECDVQGRVKKILVEDAQPVEYDQPLFVVET